MRKLTNVERKAVRLVRDDRVDFGELSWTEIAPGDLRRVITGKVRGDSGTYQVQIDPEGKTCDCPHGQHHSPAARCSHVIALELWVDYHWEGETVDQDEDEPLDSDEERHLAEQQILDRIALR